MADDLVEDRLREIAIGPNKVSSYAPNHVLRNAAHEIERLRVALSTAHAEAYRRGVEDGMAMKSTPAKAYACPFDGDPDLDITEPCPVCGTLGTHDSEDKCPFPPRAAIRSLTAPDKEGA